MNRAEHLAREWRNEYRKLRTRAFFRKLEESAFTRADYIAFLRESYHNVTHNTKKMALFQAHMASDLPQLERRFLKHAAMEVGHDIMALDDLRVLGVDPAAVRSARPAPETEALTGFIVFQIQHRNPYAYLGYLYHLEALPTTAGEMAMKALLHAGIPKEAMTFLQEHTEADTAHMKLNNDYVEGFIRNDSDFEALLYGMRGSARLHGIMLDAALESIPASHPEKALA